MSRPPNRRRRVLLTVAIVVAALCATVIVRLGSRWVLQVRAWRGPTGTPSSIAVTSSRLEPVTPEFSHDVETIVLGLPAPPAGIEFDDPYIRFRLASGGMIVTTGSRPDTDAPRHIRTLVEGANAAPIDAWTLFWMPREAFNVHIARLLSGVIGRVNAETYELVTGDGVVALVSKTRGEGGRDGSALVWWEREQIALNLFAVDVDDPQRVLREVIVRTRPKAER